VRRDRAGREQRVAAEGRDVALVHAAHAVRPLQLGHRGHRRQGVFV
jgi:hypothetical protein